MTYVGDRDKTEFMAPGSPPAFGDDYSPRQPSREDTVAGSAIPTRFGSARSPSTSNAWLPQGNTCSSGQQDRFGSRAADADTTDACDDTHMKRLSEVVHTSSDLSPSSADVWSPIPGYEASSLDLDLLLVGSKFAAGTYGQLFRGLYDGKPVAVKLLKQPKRQTGADAAIRQDMEQQCLQEVDMLSRLQHSNVLSFIGACKNPPYWCIVSEYMAGGDLRGFLSRQEGSPLPLPQVVHLALEIAKGMEHLHSKGVVHRDLKPDNLLLSSDQQTIKISDFGVSRIEASEVMTAETGTYRWMAPEMIEHRPYDRKVDVYSFGIVLWELYSMELPFQGMSAVQAAFAVVNKSARPPMSKSCPGVLSKLIQDCWNQKPEKRPTSLEIVQCLEQMEAALATDPDALAKMAVADDQANDADASHQVFPHQNETAPACCAIL